MDQSGRLWSDHTYMNVREEVVKNPIHNYSSWEEWATTDNKLIKKTDINKTTDESKLLKLLIVEE